MAAYTTIDDPGLFYKTVIYTGNAGTQTISGVGFQPDLVWTKKRNSTGSHNLIDSVRAATKEINSNTANAEVTSGSGLTAFTSDGFSLSNDSNYNGSNTYLSWNWNAGTTSGIAGSPSITPTGYSFNQTSGFSIIHFTGNERGGATIPHGLGVAPHFILTKSLDSGSDWGAFHQKADPTAPEDKAFKFNSTAGVTDQVAMWNDTAPSATLVTLGTEDRSNDADPMIAYCFAPKQGFSKFGSYVGNGNADAPFVYTGFRPKFLIIKEHDSTNNWVLWDDQRNPINEGTHCALTPNGFAVDNCNTGYLVMDFLSNGFKYTDTNAIANTAGQDYMYIAFAHSPFVNSSGVAGNAV